MSYMIRSVIPRIHRFKKAAYSYAWDKKTDEILPDHYKRRCIDFQTREPKPVHYIPAQSKWTYDVTQHIPVPVQDIGPVVVYPDDIKMGLFGGEGYIRGFRRKSKYKPRIPKVYAPQVKVEYLHSEILDQWFKIPTTIRVMNQITTLMGLDHYILATHERDLNSQLGMKLKRDMLIALAQPDKLYSDNPEKRKFIMKSYGKYAIPLEEAEWIGLPVSQAIHKAKAGMKSEKQAQIQPLKDIYRKQYIAKLMDSDSVSDELEEQAKLYGN